MPEQESTHQKALAINLDSTKYGAIAEIGVGQEVARWFFRVGAAAGTVAKTLSAYDMTVSDEIYGKSSRYVARDRLDAMLDFEYGRLIDRLEPERGAEMWSLPETGIAKLENTEPTTRLRHLYRYMRETGTLLTVEAS